MLENDTIRLRAMEPEDCEAMYRWENDTRLWPLGDTSRPFSKAVIREFIEGASSDIHTARQLRLIIELRERGEPLGCADLFAFDPLHRRAGVGILIYWEEHRRKGYALQVLGLLAEYAFGHLDMHQLWADIPASNTASLKLFRKAGFTGDAIRRAWVRRPDGGWEDACFMQLLR